LLLHKQKTFFRFLPKGYDHKLLNPFQDRKNVDIINWIDHEKKYATFTPPTQANCSQTLHLNKMKKKMKKMNEIV
jgi:hypothetical protein